MSLSRIKAILLQELFITKRSLEVIMDLFFFSIISILMFGFMSKFLSAEANVKGAHYFLIGVLLWEIIRVNQYSMSVGSLWNIWSRNLSNMFIAPLSLKEYMIAQMLSGVIKTLIVFVIISTIASELFAFNIFELGIINLFLFFLNLTFFAWSIGIIILGFIFRFGTRIQALAWALVFIFQPLTASFFPLKILPEPFLTIAYLFPATHVFEAARLSLNNNQVNWDLLSVALIENVVYLIFSIWLFNIMFNKSKETAQFTRNEG